MMPHTQTTATQTYAEQVKTRLRSCATLSEYARLKAAFLRLPSVVRNLARPTLFAVGIALRLAYAAPHLGAFYARLDAVAQVGQPVTAEATEPLTGIEAARAAVVAARKALDMARFHRDGVVTIYCRDAELGRAERHLASLSA